MDVPPYVMDYSVLGWKYRKGNAKGQGESLVDGVDLVDPVGEGRDERFSERTR